MGEEAAASAGEKAGEKAGERRPSAALFVLFGAACYATSGPLARWGRPTHPLIIAFGRLLLAALILGTIERRPIAEAFARLSWKQRGIVLFAGACLGVHFALFQLGLENTSLPAAVSLISLEPLSVVLAAWLFLSIRPSRREQMGVLFASAGAVVVAQGAGQGEHKLSGDLLVLGAVVLYGLYLTVARALKDALPARAYAAMVYAGAAVVTGLALLLPGAREGLAAPPPHGLVAIGAALLHALPTATEITGTLIILLGSALAITAPAPRPPSTIEKRDP